MQSCRLRSRTATPDERQYVGATSLEAVLDDRSALAAGPFIEPQRKPATAMRAQQQQQHRSKGLERAAVFARGESDGAAAWTARPCLCAAHRRRFDAQGGCVSEMLRVHA
jgi:hypothetical protein